MQPQKKTKKTLRFWHRGRQKSWSIDQPKEKSKTALRTASGTVPGEVCVTRGWYFEATACALLTEQGSLALRVAAALFWEYDVTFPCCV